MKKLILFVILFKLFSIIFTKECYTCSGINCYRTGLVNRKKTCTDPMDICVTIYDRWNVAIRDCLLEIDEEHRSKCRHPNHPECDKCSSSLCNKYGRKSFNCIICNSNDNIDCRNNPENIKSTRCPIPTGINSYCSVRNDGNSIIRGCATTAKEQIDCFRNNKSCQLCLSSDLENCNDFKL